MNRKNRIISEKVAKLMTDQISRELYNHNVYRSFANFYYNYGLLKLYQYYDMRANEEYNHHQWLRDRLNRAGVDFSYPAVPQVKQEHIILGPEGSFDRTVNLEIETTAWISKIVEACLEERDFQTERWLKTVMLEEQFEEEVVSRTVAEIAQQEDVDWLTKEDSILNYYNHEQQENFDKRDLIQ